MTFSSSKWFTIYLAHSHSVFLDFKLARVTHWSFWVFEIVLVYRIMPALGSLLHSREPLCVITWQTLSLIVNYTHTHALMLKASMPGQTLIFTLYMHSHTLFTPAKCTDKLQRKRRDKYSEQKTKTDRVKWNKRVPWPSHRGVSSVPCYHSEGPQAESELSRDHNHAGYWRWWCQWQHQRPLGCFLCL